MCAQIREVSLQTRMRMPVPRSNQEQNVIPFSTTWPQQDPLNMWICSSNRSHTMAATFTPLIRFLRPSQFHVKDLGPSAQSPSHCTPSPYILDARPAETEPPPQAPGPRPVSFQGPAPRPRVGVEGMTEGSSSPEPRRREDSKTRSALLNQSTWNPSTFGTRCL